MQVGRQKRDISTQLQQTVRSKMLTSRVATTATRINYRRPGALFHTCFVALFKQTHPNSRERERERVIQKVAIDCTLPRENEKERKEEKSQNKTCIQTFLLRREQFFAPREVPMETRRSKSLGIEERKKFRPRYLPFTLLFRVQTHYRFFEENRRRKEGTLFDHRSGRWPGFDDTKVYETT